MLPSRFPGDRLGRRDAACSFTAADSKHPRAGNQRKCANEGLCLAKSRDGGFQNFAIGNVPAVQFSILARIRSQRRSIERDAGKQTARARSG
jgi:hypothetical protein